MALFSIPHVRVRAIAAAIPRETVLNDDLDVLKGSDKQAFVRTVGINARRVAPPSICASDLCVAAARTILQRLQLSPAEIGIMLFVTQTPDYPLPGNGMLVQQQLGLPESTYVVDMHQGCAGYVYGMATLAGLMNATQIERGLLLVGDTMTRILSSRDRSTVPLFSDAGSATLIERDAQSDLMHFNLGSNGRGADIIQVQSGGARLPFGPESLLSVEDRAGNDRASVHLAMRGIDVLHYSLKYVVPNVKQLLSFAQADLSTPDYYVFHQANRILNDSLVRNLKIPAEKVPDSLTEYGNTSCATIPLTVCHCLGEALAHSSKNLLLAGFGAGFSWGSALIRADSVLCPQPIEIDGVRNGV